MLRFEQQQREQGLLDSEELSEDEGYRPPPVPPIPSEHAATRQREVSAETSTGSDEHDRASQASEAGLGRDGPAGDGRPTPLDNRASAIARAGLGRGPPPSAASSPAAGPKRFSSFPSTSQAGLERRSSRHSLRSVSQRTATHHASGYGHATAPPSARTASFGSSRFASGAGSLFSPSLAGASTSCLPGYGASVVVGKVEFDIHAASRQGKWYEGWLASASQPVSQSASLLAKAPHAPDQPPVAPCEKGSDVARVPADGALPHNGDMLMGTGPTAGTGLDVPGETSPARSESTPLAETVPLPSGLSDGDSSMVDKLANLTASAEPSPELHPGDTSFGTLPPPSHAPSSLPSRPASVASTLMEDEESSASEPGLGFVDDQQSVDDGYAPLADDDERATKPTASDAGSDDSRYGRATEEGGDAASINSDPLADVFQSDAATWRSIADDESQPRIDERDAIETTGLGISGARHVSEIEASAAPGVLERREADESLDEQGLPPPQDDVRDVMSMLSSTPTTATHPINLASPIRLATSDAAAADTGVFPPAPQPEVARGRENVDEDRTSPFLPSHSAQTSISTVNFSVRPPSTIASMSPEYVAARKQRQGWTNVPAVVDPSMSSSSSSSIAGLASDSARSSSSTGLMENLDDLERALADLSPRASARSRMPAVFSPATILQEADARQVEEPRPSFPPRTSSREQSEEGEVPAAANPAAPAPPPSLLASRPAFRYRALASNSDTAGDAFGQPLSQDVTDVSPTATATPAAPSEPVRIPRSSSLHKPEGRVEPQPHLIALPPSPMPASVATFAHTPEALEETLPALPAASPSWPAAPPLPPSPSPPAMPFANFVPRQSVPPPPPPSTEEFHPTQSRSPAARKGGFKWGSRNKSIDAGKANAAPAADGPSSAGDDPSSSNGAKSPLGSFFGKFGGKGDRKGFFRRGDCASPPVRASLAFCSRVSDHFDLTNSHLSRTARSRTRGRRGARTSAAATLARRRVRAPHPRLWTPSPPVRLCRLAAATARPLPGRASPVAVSGGERRTGAASACGPHAHAAAGRALCVGVTCVTCGPCGRSAIGRLAGRRIKRVARRLATSCDSIRAARRSFRLVHCRQRRRAIEPRAAPARILVFRLAVPARLVLLGSVGVGGPLPLRARLRPLERVRALVLFRLRRAGHPSRVRRTAPFAHFRSDRRSRAPHAALPGLGTRDARRVAARRHARLAWRGVGVWVVAACDDGACDGREGRDVEREGPGPLERRHRSAAEPDARHRLCARGPDACA